MDLLIPALGLCLLLAVATAVLRVGTGGAAFERAKAALTRMHWLPALVAIAVYTRVFTVLDERLGLPNLYLPLIAGTFAWAFSRWLLSGAAGGEAFKTALWLYLAIVTVALSALFHAEFPQETLSDFRKLFPDGLVVLVVPLLLSSVASARQLLWSMILAGAFLGALTAYQHLFGQFGSDFGGFAQIHVMPGETRRAAGPTSPNYFALHMVALAPLAFDRAVAERRGAMRALAVAAFALIVLAVLFTYSRGGFLTLAAVLAVCVVRLPRRVRLFALLAVPLSAVLLFAAAPDDWFERFDRLGDSASILRGDPIDDGAVRGRFSEMGSALLMFVDHPVLGVGYANFKPSYPAYAKHLALDAREDRAGHSLYLETLAEMGILGGLALLALLGCALSSVRSARARLLAMGRRDDASFFGAFGFALIAFMLGSVLLHLSFAPYFWLLVGTAIALPEAVRRTADEENATSHRSAHARNALARDVSAGQFS